LSYIVPRILSGRLIEAIRYDGGFVIAAAVARGQAIKT